MHVVIWRLLKLLLESLLIFFFLLFVAQTFLFFLGGGSLVFFFSLSVFLINVLIWILESTSFTSWSSGMRKNSGLKLYQNQIFWSFNLLLPKIKKHSGIPYTSISNRKVLNDNREDLSKFFALSNVAKFLWNKRHKNFLNTTWWPFWNFLTCNSYLIWLCL